jgi:hypothetical protein
MVARTVVHASSRCRRPLRRWLASTRSHGRSLSCTATDASAIGRDCSHARARKGSLHGHRFRVDSALPGSPAFEELAANGTAGDLLLGCRSRDH